MAKKGRFKSREVETCPECGGLLVQKGRGYRCGFCRRSFTEDDIRDCFET